MKKQILTLITLALATALSAQIPNYVPSNGLVGWWAFNGNANDESGNGNNGTVNGATLTTDRFGVADKAYSFDGVDDYISTYRPGYNSFTVSMWYKINSVALGHPLIDGFDSYYDIYFYQSGLRYATFSGINQYSEVICNLNLDLAIWKNIVFAFENNSIKVYSNGNLIDQYAVLPLQGYTGNHVFGASLTGSDQFLLGSLDDIGIWNRALTQCEIQDLYNAELNSAAGINAGADQTVCEGEFITLTGSGGTNYVWNNSVVDGVPFIPTASMDYPLLGQDANGCIGTDTMHVELISTSSSTQTQTALDSYTWPVNGQTYTQSGLYYDTLTNASGCDSVITLDLTLSFTGIDQIQLNASKKLAKITDLNGRETPFRKNTVLLFIYEDGTVERAYVTE
jgi:hypothetical protein